MLNTLNIVCEAAEMLQEPRQTQRGRGQSWEEKVELKEEKVCGRGRRNRRDGDVFQQVAPCDQAGDTRR